MTGVQTCALPISLYTRLPGFPRSCSLGLSLSLSLSLLVSLCPTSLSFPLSVCATSLALEPHLSLFVLLLSSSVSLSLSVLHCAMAYKQGEDARQREQVTEVNWLNSLLGIRRRCSMTPFASSFKKRPKPPTNQIHLSPPSRCLSPPSLCLSLALSILLPPFSEALPLSDGHNHSPSPSAWSSPASIEHQCKIGRAHV